MIATNDKLEDPSHISADEVRDHVAGDWIVWRRDDNGNGFIVVSKLTYDEAKSLTSTLERKAHKQFYWYAKVGSST